MLKHILIPLDGSSLAEEALIYAEEIIDPHGQLTLVAAVDMPDVLPTGFYPIADPSLMSSGLREATNYYKPNEIIEQGRVYLESVAQKLQTKLNVSVAVRVEISEPAELIIRLSEELKADAIVMSTHGRSGISRWLFGSVTSRVLSHSLVPVMVIPNKDRQVKTQKSMAQSGEVS